MKDENGEEFFSFIEESDDEEKREWDNLSAVEKLGCIKYVRLMRVLSSGLYPISDVDKRWLSENCDLPTYLIPFEIL